MDMFLNRIQFTKKVKAGYIVELDIISRKTILEYYELPKLQISENENWTTSSKGLWISVGVFLSGGYDSTLVTALLQKNRKEKLNTFTIGFEDKKFNEAKNVSQHLGTNTIVQIKKH